MLAGIKVENNRCIVLPQHNIIRFYVIVNKPETMKMLEITFNPFQINIRTKRTAFIIEPIRKTNAIFGENEAGDSIILYRAAQILSNIGVWTFRISQIRISSIRVSHERRPIWAAGLYPSRSGRLT